MPEHVVDVTVNGKITDVGSVENTIKDIIIYDADGNNISEFYEISSVHGKLTIL